MSLSKKNYEAIVECILKVRKDAQEELSTTGDFHFLEVILWKIVLELSDYFKSDNTNFKPEKFKEACGYYRVTKK